MTEKTELWVPTLEKETSIVQFNHWAPLVPVKEDVLKLIDGKKYIFSGFMNNPVELYDGNTITACVKYFDSIDEAFDSMEKLSTFGNLFLYGLEYHENRLKIRYGSINKVNF